MISTRWGKGTLTLSDVYKYVGEFKENKYHGQGPVTSADGSTYVAEFKESIFHGQGTFTYANGSAKRGYYMNGEYVPDICQAWGSPKAPRPLDNVCSSD